MALDIKVSQFWDCEENVASWIACAIFERVEMSEREERVEFYNMFRENGDWKTNFNNEWGDALVEYVNSDILDSMDIPKSLVRAMLSVVQDDLSLKNTRSESVYEPDILMDIKALYERDEYNNTTDDSDDDDEKEPEPDGDGSDDE